MRASRIFDNFFYFLAWRLPRIFQFFLGVSRHLNAVDSIFFVDVESASTPASNRTKEIFFIVVYCNIDSLYDLFPLIFCIYRNEIIFDHKKDKISQLISIKYYFGLWATATDFVRDDWFFYILFGKLFFRFCLGR